MGRAKQSVDPAHAKTDMERCVMVLEVVRHMRPRYTLTKPALRHAQMRQRVAVFTEVVLLFRTGLRLG